MFAEEYERRRVKTLEKLNEIDLMPFFEEYNDILEVMEQIEDKHPNSFCYITIYDFIEYVNDRYYGKIRIYFNIAIFYENWNNVE